MTVEIEICGTCKEETDCDFVTRCGHWFHESCIKTWLYRQKVCPYCKQTVSSSKMNEKVMLNLKNLKIDETKKREVMGFFEYYIVPKIFRHLSSIPSYDLDAIRILIAAGWDINGKEAGALNLLKRACEKDDVYRLNILFEAGLKLAKDSEWYKEALEVANNNSSYSAIKCIERCFSSMYIKRNVTGDGSTPLHEACSTNNFALVKSLIESGASVNARNKLGVTPLHLSCSSADIEIINYLIENGAEINCVDLNGKSPLYEAMLSKIERRDVLERFLELKAHLSYLDQNRNTLLHAALIAQKFKSSELLVDHFPDINSLNCFDESVLHLAADFAPVSLIEKLLERGCDAKLKDSNGNTPLHRAVTSNTPDVVAALLKDDKSDVNAVDSNNRTALSLAMRRMGSSSLAKLLIENGADSNIKDKDGKTALDISLEKMFL